MASGLWSRIGPGARLWAVLLVPLAAEAAPRLPELAVGAVLLAGMAAGQRRFPLGALAGAAAIAAAAELVLAPTAFGPARLWPLAATAVLAYLAGRRLPDGRPVLAALAGVAAAGLPVGLLVGFVFDGGSRGGFGLLFGVYDWFVLVLGLLLAVAPAWLVGRYRRQRAALVAAGWERAALLAHQQRIEADRARLAERARIARNMHDSLGHEWTLIALRAAALEVSPRLDDETRTAARELRTGVAIATERLRDVIGVLRVDAGAYEPPDIGALVARAADAGLAVAWDPAPEPSDLPALVRHAARRVAQEALTNAARHAPGAPVALRVEHGDNSTTVTVTNGAPSGAGAAGTSGSGLVGLRERVRLLGGTLDAGPDGPGFTVLAVLPHDAPPVAPPPPDARRELDEALREGRRGVAAAVRVPLLGAVAVAVLALGLFLLVGTANRLDPATFDRSPVGMAAAAVEAELPPFQVLGDPGRTLRRPPGDAVCRYYWSREPTDDRLIFRLCFDAHRLVSKEAVPRAALSGPAQEGTS